MRIGVMAPGISRHDAVGNDAVGMYLVLKRAGHDAYLLTPGGVSDSPYPTWRYDDASWLFSDPASLIIYHYCTVDPYAVSVLSRATCRLALRYHNVTPSHFMAPYSLEFTAACKAGRRGIASMAALPFDFVLSDSKYNAGDLIQADYPATHIEILPPFHAVQELLREHGDPATAEHLGRSPINLLCVGRTVPNKGHSLMIDAMSLLKRRGVNVTLQMVGSFDPRLRGYTDMLFDKVQQGELSDRVHFHPQVGGGALATYYRNSDIFWTASQHEGFCVPAVEAMAFGLPILSTTKGALPDTCGDAALYADTPAGMAEKIEEFAMSDDLRFEYARRGACRYREFDNQTIAARLLEAVERSWGPPASIHRDWFGLPDAERLAVLAQRHYSRPMLTEGHRRAAVTALLTIAGDDLEVEAYLASDQMKLYAGRIAMPPNGERLSAAARLLWTFSALAHTRFPLHDPESVVAYWSWFLRWSSLALSPLMSAHERAIVTMSRT